MSEPVRVVRHSPGRLRLHAPGLATDNGAAIERISAAVGVHGVRLNEHTGNVLIEFDQHRIDAPDVLALVAEECAPARRTRDGVSTSAVAGPPGGSGWLRAECSQTIRGRPEDCMSALLEFEHYPEWQTYVTAVRVDLRDQRGRAIRVATRAEFGERQVEFNTSYRYPSRNRILFAPEDVPLGALRGSWGFRSVGSDRTRATCVLELKPGWRLGLILRGSLYEQGRDAITDHLMHELRARVEGPRGPNHRVTRSCGGEGVADAPLAAAPVRVELIDAHRQAVRVPGGGDLAQGLHSLRPSPERQAQHVAKHRGQWSGHGLEVASHGSCRQSEYASAGSSVAVVTDASYFAATSLTG